MSLETRGQPDAGWLAATDCCLMFQRLFNLACSILLLMYPAVAVVVADSAVFCLDGILQHHASTRRCDWLSRLPLRNLHQLHGSVQRREVGATHTPIAV